MEIVTDEIQEGICTCPSCGEVFIRWYGDEVVGVCCQHCGQYIED
jgi:hypothetical protein